MVQAKVSSHLCFARGTLPELQSNLRWLLLVLGLEIPRQSQAVNLIWLPLGLTEASCCLFDRTYKPRPAILMEKRLGWAHKLGEEESLGISRAGQTVLAGLMETQYMAPAYWLCGGGFSKGTMASACLDAKHFSFSLYTTGAFQAATLVLELRE